VALFAERGYAGTTIALIASRIGITDAGVLYHVPSKQALFVEALETFGAEQLERIIRLAEPGGITAIEQLGAWGSLMEERPDLLALQIVLDAEGVLPTSELHGYWTVRHCALISLVEGLFAQAVERGEIDPATDASAEARAFVAHLDGARLQWFSSEGEASIAISVERYVRLLVDRIRPHG
jgi:AcrR family transcriptional regulator